MFIYSQSGLRPHRVAPASLKPSLPIASAPSVHPSCRPTSPKRCAASRVEEAVTIFVVDYECRDRAALSRMLHYNGYAVQAFASCSAFLDTFRPNTRGCLIVDALTLGVSGTDAIARLRDEGDGFPTIVISANVSASMVVQAMKAGAVDFIEKPIDRDELFASLRRALEQAREADGLSGLRRKAPDRIAELTPRQHQILELVLAGQSSKNIAVNLGINQRTVENHRAQIAKKAGARSLPLLVQTAIRAGFCSGRSGCSQPEYRAAQT